MAGILERYKDFFPAEVNAPGFPRVSLEEGNTPLVPAPALAEKTGVPGLRVYLKYEGLNPTGSFKDRGMTYAVSRAKHEGARYLLCASTGNTSASAAAYGARAGLETLILIPQGKIAMGKLSQALLYGAAMVEIEGNFDQALDLVRELGATRPEIAIVNSINPYRLEGQRSGAFEVCDQLGKIRCHCEEVVFEGCARENADVAISSTAPEYLFIPVGNAGNITAYWQGFEAYHAAGKTKSLPMMCGYQAAGAAPIVKGHKIENPETLATAIRIGNPASWEGALRVRDASGGWIDCVSDEEIVAAYQLLARSEGIFCEPASAASVAGLLKASQAGQVKPKTTVVCVLTGNGLKDPDTAIAVGAREARRVTLPPEAARIAAFLGV